MLGHFKANLGSSRWAPAAIFSAACSAVQITGAWHQREFVIKRSRTIFFKHWDRSGMLGLTLKAVLRVDHPYTKKWSPDLISEMASSRITRKIRGETSFKCIILVGRVVQTTFRAKKRRLLNSPLHNHNQKRQKRVLYNCRMIQPPPPQFEMSFLNWINLLY